MADGPLPGQAIDRFIVEEMEASRRRRPGYIHLAPWKENAFILYGRGKTGCQAAFTIDGPEVRCTLQGASLRKMASRLHSRTVVEWR